MWRAKLSPCSAVKSFLPVGVDEAPSEEGEKTEKKASRKSKKEVADQATLDVE